MAARSFFTRLGNAENSAKTAPRAVGGVDLRKPLPWIVGAFALAVAACSGVADDDASSASAVSVPGRWKPSADAAEVGKDVRITYEGAPSWNGTSSCSGRLREGARRLGNYLARNRFDGEITSIGGYACRRNTANSRQMSVHGTGRALDIFIPTVGGAADNTRGDKVANWLIENSERIGVQLIIWDRSIWRANGTNDSPYGGPVPHVDHLHVEITTEAAAAKTPFFVANEDAMTYTGENDEDGGTEGPVGDESEEEDEDGGTADASAPAPTTPTADAGPPAPEPEEKAEPAPEVDTPAPGDDGSEHEETAEEEEGPGEVDSLGLGTDDDEHDRRRSQGSGSWSGEVDEQPQGCAVSSRAAGGTTPAVPLGTVGLGLAVVALVRRRRA